MMTIQKSFAIQGVENEIALLRLQEVIALAKQQLGWVGKAVIDAEKVTYYKFGLKLGISRLSTNGLVVNEQGIIRNVGNIIPEIQDRQVLTDLCQLFGLRCSF